MKIVIIGGTGLIGTKLASLLREKGHNVLQASPRTGVDANCDRDQTCGTGPKAAGAKRKAAAVVRYRREPWEDL